VVHLDIAAVTGAPGQTVRVSVNIRSSGFPTVATGNDITYPNDVFSLDPTSCVINTATRKTLVVSVLPPDPYNPRTPRSGPTCRRSEPRSIPDGLLYSCQLVITPSAPVDTYDLLNDGIVAFGADGAEYEFVTGRMAS